MQSHRPILLGGLLLLGGCHAPRLETIDQSVADFATRPLDVAPAIAPPASDTQPPASSAAAANPGAADQGIQAASLQAPGGAPTQVLPTLQRYQLEIPKAVPGSEAPLIKLPADRAEREKTIDRLYPDLPALPEQPVPQPGPDGRPYTLADLQQLAAANSPQLRQAASDVEAARGNLIQARAYPNPTVGYEGVANQSNTGTGAYGIWVDQVIKTGGKLKLQSAAAEKDLQNAELALKRARSDLATQIRTAYYNLIVAQETMRVNRALARFTDEIFRLQADLLRAGQAASHEPAALRSQAATIRLSYQQSIANYIYAWKQLVATIGLRQLPLSAVEGQVDAIFPYYEYDTVLAHVLRNHTDVLTARNGLEKARYNLQFAQVTPVPDVEVRYDLLKETNFAPFNAFHTVSVSGPLPVWDKNKGAIRTAAAALVRASEEPHRVEVTLTNGLATAYASYKTNLDAVEYYRRDILPEQVRYYRGVFERRKIDITAPFGDLVQAQQTLAAAVSAYLGVLGQLWTSVVNVTDYLQTDDLYQLGKPLELPKLPDLDALHVWPCPHPQPMPPGATACPPVGPSLPPETIPAARSAGPRGNKAADGVQSLRQQRVAETAVPQRALDGTANDSDRGPPTLLSSRGAWGADDTPLAIPLSW
jgi:cobalt-zinc-cadmium efflux system outer membrane protein